MNVEMYILQQQVIPKIIYGFTSSALFNLKKIFPSCKVINITLNYPNSVGALDYYNITQYQCVNGIEEMKLSLQMIYVHSYYIDGLEYLYESTYNFFYYCNRLLLTFKEAEVGDFVLAVFGTNYFTNSCIRNNDDPETRVS